MLKTMLSVYPYILITGVVSLVLFGIYLSIVFFMYMSPTDIMTFVHKANEKRNSKKTPLKTIIYATYTIATGLMIYNIVREVIRTEMYLHGKRKTCLVYETMDKIINC